MMIPRITISFYLFLGLFIGSCGIEVGNPGDAPKKSVGLTVASNTPSEKPGGRLLANGFEVTEFYVSIADLRFEGGTKAEFEGPYSLDLITSGNAQTIDLGEANVAEGSYTRIRADLERAESGPGELMDRILYIAGTYNSMPVEIWHDTTESFDIKNDNGIEIESALDLQILLPIESILAGVDLDSAEDGNGNGIIEINPDDADDSSTNDDLADQIKDNLKASAEFFED